MSVVAKNRKAFHNYFIEDRYEAGIVLQGTEIKSIRQGRVQLGDAYISIRHGEAFIKGMHIGTYEQGNRFNHDETRDRKLLLHKHEIEKLQKAETLQGYTIVPLGMHLVKGRAKLEIATAKGKHLYDKRQVEKERSMKREIERATRR
ncbi:SsrA-binding protein SmpB [Erysipelothrix urinaevulpis]|uniref:SsrA-binding protein SmpB n=1 Tax=Erysipelothrix urinaevulpis TaxID=2683717 RepID=UPI00135C2699|nr:SsrA-binding protein SmpB [Erysipelothrix urinaevulpis]